MVLDDNFNVVTDILNKTQAELKKMKPVSILVAGKTGVGKSTLINNLFREKVALTGIGKPVTEHLRKIRKEGIPLVLYDTKGFELESEVQADIQEQIFQLVKTKKSEKNPIDLVYYCIHALSGRIEETEIAFIRELSKTVPVLIVLTQSFGETARDLLVYIEELNLPVAGVHAVLAEPYKISDDYILPQAGLELLVARSLEIIPKEKEEAFNNAQQGDISRKASAARKWATRYIASSFGVGFVPIPFSDASLLVPMQVTLLAHITAIFGLSIDRSTLVSLVAAVGGTGTATFVGRSLVSNVLKFIPGAGTLVGGAISGVTAATVTSALAYSYIEVLTLIAVGEKEGKSFDLDELKELMKKSFQSKLKQQKNPRSRPKEEGRREVGVTGVAPSSDEEDTNPRFLSRLTNQTREWLKRKNR